MNQMLQELLRRVFEKAAIHADRDSLNARAEHVAHYISEEHSYPLSAKTIIRYYHGITEPGMRVKDGLACYLGYDNFEKFIATAQQPLNQTTKKPGGGYSVQFFAERKRIVFLGAVIVLIVGFIGFQAGREKCMVWRKTHYEQVFCSGGRGEVPYSDFILENFRKVTVTDSTKFFEGGDPRIWYDKINSEQIEYFSAPGINPRSGETVKPISQYMIDKYIRRKPPSKKK